MRAYKLPTFLIDVIQQEYYSRWLERKAKAHVKRDRRKNPLITTSSYKKKIHQAVLDSKGLDAYTGEQLDWSLISKYRSELAKKYGGTYKKEFALLPSVDHVSGREISSEFKICSWRTNDAKNDLSVDEFIELCSKVISHRSNSDQ